MAEKVIIRSENIDLHGDFMPLRMMEEYVSAVNGQYKMRFLINHRRDLPPVGYFDNAEIKIIDNIHHALVEPIEYQNRQIASWDENLLIEDAGIKIQFIGRHDSDTEKFQISVDKNNFEDFMALNLTGQKLKSIYGEEVSLNLDTRKSLLPEPRVIITFVEYWIVLYPVLRPFLSKIGESIAEDIAEDLYKHCKSKVKSVINKLRESVRVIRNNMVPKDQVLTTIFEIPGSPNIELHIKSDDPSKIEKGLKASNLYKIHKKIGEFQKILDFTEIHFVLNSKDKWDFSYLITHDGKIVGTIDTFNKRDKLFNKIRLSPTKAYSMGAQNVKYSIQRNPLKDNPSQP